jgi:hypothetical protein
VAGRSEGFATKTPVKEDAREAHQIRFATATPGSDILSGCLVGLPNPLAFAHDPFKLIV